MKKKDGFKDEKYIALPIKNEIDYTKHPLINGTYITELGLYPSAKYHYRERMEGIDENIFIYCMEGSGVIELLHNKIIQLNAGEIFCIPAKTPHRYYALSENPWSIIWIHFVSDMMDLFGDDKINISSPEKKHLLQTHFINLLQISEKEFNQHHFIVISKLLSLILAETYLLEDKVSFDKQNQYLSKCIRYMNENINQELTLKQLAHHLKISQSYLSTIFKKYTQQSPIEFLIHLKIDQACKYMKMTDLKIYEIAKKVGYEDAYYFSRLFKKYTGHSPKVYRAQMEEGFNSQKNEN
ncbi:helix-turn-helix transcriptional regulator [Listeria booriae]|uniref:helix-turn-helix transcriptional regulator n=1 Tax=Listeria booriae TaxID=1552123 RepID=UPI001625ABC4|nr:AraC family transcriptional regulator [Listeria booriae]MBC2259743.1 AraC family transcriptional regulator [Listeria booriae]